MILVFALLSEAKPWIEFYGAKGIGHSLGSIRVFESSQATILVTGMGKVPSAIAVTWFSSRLSPEFRASLPIWNLGGSGSVSQEIPLGSFFRIHQVRDLSSGKEEFPSVLDFSKDFLEGPLVTVDQAIVSQQVPHSIRETDLVDMEAFGFFQAAVQFFPHENIRIGKWVTDYLQVCDPKLSETFAYQSLEKILPLLSNEKKEKEDSKAFSEIKTILLAAKEKGYTEAMLREVESLLRYYRLQFPEKEWPPLPDFTDKKEDRKRKHKEWKAQFVL